MSEKPDGLNEQLDILLQRNGQSNPVNRARIRHASIATVLADDQILAIGIDEEANQVRTHIVAAL